MVKQEKVKKCKVGFLSQKHIIKNGCCPAHHWQIFTFTIIKNRVCCGALVVMLRQDSLLYCLAHADAILSWFWQKLHIKASFSEKKSVVLQLLKGRL